MVTPPVHTWYCVNCGASLFESEEPQHGHGPLLCEHCYKVVSDYQWQLYEDEFSERGCNHGPDDWHCGLAECRGTHRDSP